MTVDIRNDLLTLINTIKASGDSHYKAPIVTLHEGHTYIGLSPVMLEDMLDEIELWQAKAVIAEKAAAHFHEMLEQQAASDDAQP